MASVIKWVMTILSANVFDMLMSLSVRYPPLPTRIALHPGLSTGWQGVDQVLRPWCALEFPGGLSKTQSLDTPSCYPAVSLSTIDILNQIIVRCRGHPVHCGMFSDILSFFPLETRSNRPICDNEKGLQTLSRQNCPG